MTDKLATLRDETIAWLLDEYEPAVRCATLRCLLGRSDDDPEVVAARAAALRAEPISTILANQSPEGYWEKPGAGYGPKYRSTVWQIIFLDQLGADGGDERIRRGCEYVLRHSQATNGAFGGSSDSPERPPSPGSAIHCLHGNLLRALLGFGFAADPRVGRAIEWTARAVLDATPRPGSTPGPDYACRETAGQPCAWGAIKQLLALARVPTALRSTDLERAVDRGVDLLLSRDLTVADYLPDARVSKHWFELGFPWGYQADILQAIEALVENGRGDDDRLRPAIEWLVAQADERGRWRNGLSYGARASAPFELRRTPSKWVTLRALRVLRIIEQQVAERATDSDERR
jgi:hypothetical protein